jgi:hypothetical protein
LEIYRALARRDREDQSQYFSWLEKTYDEDDLLLVWTSGNAVLGKPSNSSDPRWIAFRKRLGLPP